jgi:hypothetical protein
MSGLRYLALGAALGLGLTACGATSHDATPSTVLETVTETPSAASPSTPAAIATGPVSQGATTSATADCPLLAEAAAAGDMGQRLGRVTVQSAGGHVVGCQFFDVQGTALAASEHLSGPNQPALQISSARYASATLAHNAMVLAAEKGANAHQSGSGLAYRTTFDPTDGVRQDWTYAFVSGTTLVTVHTNEFDSELDAETVAGALAGKF